ncbi:D-glycero-beta-D-manno-heptose 1-phosphate adenylyltransferase [Mucilaginibacter sp. X5P1]|uniref:D-glycero-beta-D-manno-heptose 1-phosphate adenylyltransferase n=1 Tax=Mucilaginibacter sp. X5P1 TaxID=2723088 RepID=UPI00160BBC34|nr:D-glycero-beta-D-manno-heptose 1-phosphate adenylyltransferase [Mucilaginibacter sp. X5P1]MBB6137234.1 rfaE bifunctional protein nucleotidyltransferase chain/domain [Mucilaginibacter sp. X5P1]
MQISINSILSKKLFDLTSAVRQLKEWQGKGEKIVFTNGVFDLIHIGHLSYLAEAANLGNKLIVGLNSDDSVSRIKGPDRPVNDQKSRAALLSCLCFVDMVIIFGENTPTDLISDILPDILVKGADYALENIAGANKVIANGGEIKTIKFIAGYSSSLIIEKINRQKH